MIKRMIGTLLLAGIIFSQSAAHSGKPKYHVVIDTDGALDDMRSISMLLSQNEIRVLAITCSQGTLLPDSVYVKVKSLLSAFHHELTLIALGSLKTYADWIGENPDIESTCSLSYCIYITNF